MNNYFKKILCFLIAMVTLFCNTIFCFGADYISQPYEAGTGNSSLFRIPSMIVLNNGNILTSADIRYGGGSDSPANIDTGICISEDNGKTWSDINIVNHFSDFEDKNSEEAVKASASFIDSALLQSSHGTIFLICDACPAFIGSSAAKKNGSGFIDGKIVLCDKTTEDTAENGELSIEKYPYYIDEFKNGFAPIKRFNDFEIYNGYYVDAEYNLYQHMNGEMNKVMISSYDAQGNKTENTVQANVFYAGSPVKIYPTFYTWLRKSNDSGKTWSSPCILNNQINAKGFTGICPGKGYSYSINGNERLVFAVYDTNDGYEKTCTIYSDDNGESWSRGDKITVKGPAKKSSESQMVVLNNNTLRIYSRNASNYIGYADSKDGGKTWSKHFLDASLRYCSNCMVSFIDCSKEIDGKKVIIASFPSTATRKLGVIKIGLVNKMNKIDWKYEYQVTDSEQNGSFAYSCLAELSDGSIALLYESNSAEITFKTFSIDELISESTKVSYISRIFQRIFTIMMYPIAFI